MNFSNTSEPLNETLTELNARYAAALIPFASLVGAFCVLGIFGNILVICVFCFSKEYRNTNFKIFVLSLAAIDLLSCMALMPTEILKTKHYFSFPSHLPCKVKCFFNIFTMTAAALSLLVICIDRYRKVCQPLKKQIWPELAMKIMICLIILSILLALPSPIMCGVAEVTMENLQRENITAYTCSAEKRYLNSPIRTIYKLLMTVILVIVSIAFIVMYTLIMRTVVKHWCRRESCSSVHFEPTSRSNDYSADKVEEEALSNQDEVFVPDASPSTDSENKSAVKPQAQRKISKQMSSASMAKRPSTTSSSSFMGRFSIRRMDSDASFRSRVHRRRSSAPGPGKLPYKTLIWFVLTIVFLVTFILNAGLLFMSTKEHTFSPGILAVYLLFVRLYFVNNIINPFVYALLDNRFKKSCKDLFRTTKAKLCGK